MAEKPPAAKEEANFHRRSAVSAPPQIWSVVDRWHPLFSTSDADRLTILETFRRRQHHEQGYRVGVHDLFLNATPCGYDKESPDPKRPRFHRGPLQMIGWLAALVYNAVAADFAAQLPGCRSKPLAYRRLPCINALAPGSPE